MQVTTLSSLELPGWQVGLPDHNPGPTFQAVFSSTAADGSVALMYSGGNGNGAGGTLMPE